MKFGHDLRRSQRSHRDTVAPRYIDACRQGHHRALAFMGGLLMARRARIDSMPRISESWR
ncbi:hypothetical protein UK82_29340 [Frankia sp. ACN1ag]|nr:hypothetical protein UK82_29340 [Frankia sp. ACN1ag]